MSSLDSVKANINNIKVILTKEGIKLPVQAETPMSLDFKTKFDATTKLE